MLLIVVDPDVADMCVYLRHLVEMPKTKLFRVMRSDCEVTGLFYFISVRSLHIRLILDNVVQCGVQVLVPSVLYHSASESSSSYSVLTMFRSYLC